MLLLLGVMKVIVVLMMLISDISSEMNVSLFNRHFIIISGTEEIFIEGKLINRKYLDS